VYYSRPISYNNISTSVLLALLAHRPSAFEIVCQLTRYIGKGKAGIAVHGTPSHSYGVSLAIRDHTVLPSIRHKWAHPAFTQASQAGTRFTYPGGMEGWVDLGDMLHTEIFTRPQTVTHESTNRARCRLTSLIKPTPLSSNHAATILTYLLIVLYSVLRIHKLFCMTQNQFKSLYHWLSTSNNRNRVRTRGFHEWEPRKWFFIKLQWCV